MMRLCPIRYGVKYIPIGGTYSWIKFDESNGSTSFSDEINGALTTTDPDGLLTASSDFLLTSGNALKVDFDAWGVRTALPVSQVSCAPFNIVGTSLRFTARFAGGALSGDQVSLVQLKGYLSGSYVGLGFDVAVYKLADQFNVFLGSGVVRVPCSTLIYVDTNYDIEVRFISSILTELWIDGVFIGSEADSTTLTPAGCDEYRITFEPAANLAWSFSGQAYVDNVIIDTL